MTGCDSAWEESSLHLVRDVHDVSGLRVQWRVRTLLWVILYSQRAHGLAAAERYHVSSPQFASQPSCTCEKMKQRNKKPAPGQMSGGRFDLNSDNI